MTRTLNNAPKPGQESGELAAAIEQFEAKRAEFERTVLVALSAVRRAGEAVERALANDGRRKARLDGGDG